MDKIIIYQVLPRLFGNRHTTHKANGTIEENGVGKFSDFDAAHLQTIRQMGFTHVWYTGVLRHATTTDYTRFGIPRQHPSVVKGKAGSPYAITDYYDVDPDLADHVEYRMTEWLMLVERTHHEGLKVVMDFVPNHVAREYKSIAHPVGIRDLGQDDDRRLHFSTQNNFYYCPGAAFKSPVQPKEGEEPYVEDPAKCTGNDRFDNCPGPNDWYETVKLNYGINYCDYGGRSYHFDPIPDTWKKMTEILLFWASKGIDAFRCDMAEMVPPEFWTYAIGKVKARRPEVDFIGEVYQTDKYHTYINAGFDYLYDKVGLYDCLRDVICNRRPASSITYYWQCEIDILPHMLYFLENHDEQRIASDFFCGNAQKAIPALAVCALMQRNPVMVYAGQELGERGMDAEGFSGKDGRTTIFDYWGVDTIRRAYFGGEMTPEEKHIQQQYRQILNIAHLERAVGEGEFFDLMYVNPQSEHFDPRKAFTFLRKWGDEVLLIACNFADQEADMNIMIPAHAFDYLKMNEAEVIGIDLLTSKSLLLDLHRDKAVSLRVPANGVRIVKFIIGIQGSMPVLNPHNKDEFAPAHTAEHLLNQVMARRYGCERSRNAHVERKKSKITYILNSEPTHQEVRAIEEEMNRLIEADLPVTYQMVDRNHIPEGVKIDRLPSDASELIRLVRIGDFDICPCIGKHVRSTAQIGRFVLLGTNWDAERHAFRIRFKVLPS